MKLADTYADIKRESWSDLDGNWGIIFLFNLLGTAVCIILSYMLLFFSTTALLIFLSLIADLTVFLYFHFGIFSLAYTASTHGTIRFSDGFLPLPVCWKFILCGLAFALISISIYVGTLFLLVRAFQIESPFLCVLVGTAAVVYLTVSFAPLPFLILNDPKANLFSILNRARNLMKGYKTHYLGFCLSFIGWLLVTLMTTGVGALFLTGYFYTSLNNFYHRLVRAKNGEEEQTEGKEEFTHFHL